MVNRTNVIKMVTDNLSDDLLNPVYRSMPGRKPTTGHCYVASEALYHLLGGAEAGWTPQFIRHEGQPHWYLKGPGGEILDATADQFDTPVPYENGVGLGFLTKRPSRRARILLGRIICGNN